MNNLVDICISLHSEMGDRKKRERCKSELQLDGKYINLLELMIVPAQ